MPAINDTDTKTPQLSRRQPNKHVLPRLSIKRPTQMHVLGGQIEAAFNSGLLVQRILHIIYRAEIKTKSYLILEACFEKRLLFLLLWIIIAFQTIMIFLISMVYPASNLLLYNGGGILLSVIIIRVWGF